MSFCSQTITQLRDIQNYQKKLNQNIEEYSDLKDAPTKDRIEHLRNMYSDRKLSILLIEKAFSDLEVERIRIFDEKIVVYMDNYFEDKSGKEAIAVGLAGLDSPSAWRMRFRLIETGEASSDAIVLGLIGVDSTRAWKWREAHLRRNFDIDSVIISLAGLESDRAWELREEYLQSLEALDSTSKILAIGSLFKSLVGLDSEKAWKLRYDFLDRSPNYWGAVSISLAGLDSERAWQMRQQAININPNFLSFRDLVGLDSERAWKLREEEMNRQGSDKSMIALSLIGLDSERAWQMREKLYENADTENHYWPRSLAGLSSERAWRWRSKFFNDGYKRRDIILGLSGYSPTFAWRLIAQKKAKDIKARLQLKISS